ncbi:MAG: hypothetical protein H6673_08355 [Anaerolineales bacterium]|nr:hypothetical protein [Anaerolineales bacterium]
MTFIPNTMKMLVEYMRLKQPPMDFSVAGSASPRFPSVIGYNLAGRRFHLPKDFGAKPTIALIAFEEWQQNLVDTWLPHMDGLIQDYPHAQYFELPTIYTMSPIGQATLDMWMRLGIPDRAARERTITLYLSVESFLQTLRLPTNQQIYTLLLDATGTVRWQVAGPYATDKEASLRAALDVLTANGV